MAANPPKSLGHHPSLNILLLCTAHNSLSQRLSLVLQERGHNVTLELAISDQIMAEAAAMSTPDLIICPFLTKKVPAEVYDKYLTLIIHPGPPGDAGPSALDWVLLGDDGVEPDALKALENISTNEYVLSGAGRSHWGVTVLQAIEEFDAGPVWAWDQFPFTLDGPHFPTKASLYRGPVTRAAVTACLCAIERIFSTASPSAPYIHPRLCPNPSWALESVTSGKRFLGGKTRTRPLLRPTQRDWDPRRHSAALISRRLRASDSQPGVQSQIFCQKNLYLYGGIIEHNPIPFKVAGPGSIIAQRGGAILISTADGKGVWITHIRALKPKNEALLPPKLPAMQCLRSMPELSNQLGLDDVPVWELEGFAKVPGTLQEVWIEYEQVFGTITLALVYFDFYNGAASTFQCQRLLAAINEATRRPVKISALVLMGGSYWNNGIHLGVCSVDVAAESWTNITAINDCVRAVLEAQDIVTFAAVRGNAAAGGFALATCCDFVLCHENAVINPHYRALGLYGSEYHSLTWYARAGEEGARSFMRAMLPMSAKMAQERGLVDQVIPHQDDAVSGFKLAAIQKLLAPSTRHFEGAPWTKPRRALVARTQLSRLVDSVPVCKQDWFGNLPQPLAAYRKQELDFMKLNFTDPRYHQCVKNFTGKAAPHATPFRFALHRRYAHWRKVQTDSGEDPKYFSYPTIDLEEIHSTLKIATVEPIELICPPPTSWVSGDRPLGEYPRRQRLSPRTHCRQLDAMPSASRTATADRNRGFFHAPPPGKEAIGSGSAQAPEVTPELGPATAIAPQNSLNLLSNVMSKVKLVSNKAEDCRDGAQEGNSQQAMASNKPLIGMTAPRNHNLDVPFDPQSNRLSQHQMTCYYSDCPVVK